VHSYCFYEPKPAAFRAKDKDIMQPALSSQCLAATNGPNGNLEAVSALSRVLQSRGRSAGWQSKGKPQVQAFGEMSWSRTRRGCTIRPHRQGDREMR
jgi:hypothetical protein